MKLTAKTALWVALALVIAGSIPATLVTIVMYPKVIDNGEQIDTVTQDAAVAKARAEIAAANASATRKFNRKLTTSLILGCKANNLVKLRLRQYFAREIQAVRRTDPTLYPDIPPATFAQLVTERVAQLQRTISDLSRTDCEGRYPNLPPAPEQTVLFGPRSLR